MKTTTIAEFLTPDEIETALEMWQKNPSSGYAGRVCEKLIEPNMERINKALGQENNPMYLAYAIELGMTKLDKLTHNFRGRNKNEHELGKQSESPFNATSTVGGSKRTDSHVQSSGEKKVVPLEGRTELVSV